MASELRVDRIVPTTGVPTGGGGGIVQVATTADPARTAIGTVSIPGSNQWTDSPITCTITPKSTSNKILVSGFLTGEGNAVDHLFFWRVNRSISGGSATAIEGATGTSRNEVFGPFLEGAASDNASTLTSCAFSNYLDSPATVSPVTYTFQMVYNGAATFYVNRTVTDSDNYSYERGLSYITCMEVSA